MPSAGRSADPAAGQGTPGEPDRAAGQVGSVHLVPTGAGVVQVVGLEHLPDDEHAAAAVVARLAEQAFAEGQHRVEAEVPVVGRRPGRERTVPGRGAPVLPTDPPAAGRPSPRRVLQRAGLRPEGTARGRGLDAEGQPVDLLRLARLRDDPAPGAPGAFIGMLNATLPRKRVIVQGLIGDGAGRILLCELTYKQHWDLPGGVADPAESPVTSLEREIREELGLELTVGELAAVDWLPPYRQWEDAVLLVFDLGLVPDLLDRARLQASELRGAHWVRPADAADHVAPYVSRLLDSLADRPAHRTLFLEDGLPRAGQDPAEDDRSRP